MSRATGWQMVGLGGDQSKDSEFVVLVPDGHRLVGNPGHCDRAFDDTDGAIENGLGGGDDALADIFVVVHGGNRHYSRIHGTVGHGQIDRLLCHATGIQDSKPSCNGGVFHRAAIAQYFYSAGWPLDVPAGSNGDITGLRDRPSLSLPSWVACVPTVLQDSDIQLVGFNSGRRSRRPRRPGAGWGST